MTNPTDDTTPHSEEPVSPETPATPSLGAPAEELSNTAAATEPTIPITPVPAPQQPSAQRDGAEGVAATTPQPPAYAQPPVYTPVPPAPPAPATPVAQPRYGEYAAQTPADPQSTNSAGVGQSAPTPGTPYGASYGTAPENQGATQTITDPTQPIPPTFGGHGQRPSGGPKKKRAVSPIAALIIGAIVGGAAGGGVVWGVNSATGANQSNTTVSTTGSTTNLVVNNTDSVTAITGAVAVAQPSVVTIESSAGSSSSSTSSSTSTSATGSGVILTSDGYIVTNNHVVTIDGETSSPTLTVITSDGTVYSGKVVGLDPTYDLAVIKIDATGLTAATFADSDKLNVGDTSIAIGAPLGLSNTVTDGIVSTLNRGITVQSSEASDTGSSSSDSNNSQGSNGDVWGFDFGQQGNSQTTTATSYIYLNVVQTDAAINPGNSGGALVNSSGEVIGINVAIASASSSSSSSSSSGSIGVGFAIPSNVVKRISDEIIKNGSATHGFFGASVQDSTSTGSLGVELASVTSGQAAESAGLKKGDVITSFNGVRVTDSTELTALVRSLAPGTQVEVAYTRNGSSSKTTVTLGSYEDYTASQK